MSQKAPSFCALSSRKNNADTDVFTWDREGDNPRMSVLLGEDDRRMIFLSRKMAKF